MFGRRESLGYSLEQSFRECGYNANMRGFGEVPARLTAFDIDAETLLCHPDLALQRAWIR